jgi:hypothetical protein
MKGNPLASSLEAEAIEKSRIVAKYEAVWHYIVPDLVREGGSRIVRLR